ncbi:MAG: HAMP domain-containing histidine kinase [Erysipelotrichia bacterium]|nr:HAMP domain-containing histidine kinase [Erysipelotrichia bacterium]NCC54733.1 HAMP domain-containing histidine kinase [Erysipelotrichia bacterium]
MKKRHSFRFQLIFSTSFMMIAFTLIITSILLLYMIYYLLILGRIYAMDEDVMTPIASIVITLVVLLLLAAFIASLLCGIAISSRYLKGVRGFIKNIQVMKKEGSKHALQVEGNDELAQLGNEFNDLLAQLDRSLQQQNQFVSDASHELKTPLAIVKGNLDMLQRWGKEDPEVLSSALCVSAKEVDRLISLCHELLHLTREIDVDKTIHTSIKKVVDEVVSDFQKLHEDFILQVEVEDVLVLMKEEHLKQLLIILIDNAIKYAKTTRKEIEVRYHNHQLTVLDYGIGIKEDKLPYIFDRFYKIDESRNANQDSFGLGLAIAKRICTYYDYTIEVESKVNEYTKFSIILKQEDVK